jgi:uncharacterized repeat protein (TIGR03803 family)
MRDKALMMFAVTLMLATSAWASSETDLYNFNSVSGGTDGYYGYAGLIADKSGNLYGTTYYGGKGYGVVYQLTLSGGVWTETVLHPFAVGTTDGEYPIGGLVSDKAGNLYGVTYQGGTSNLGTVYELKKSGGGFTFSVIYSFAGYPKDGEYPYSTSLVFDAKGNLYGTTEYGGSNNLGTIFLLKQSKGAWAERVLHSFAGTADGAYPVAGLTVGKGGFLYGTTYAGGPTYNIGTAYELFQTRGLWVERPIFTFSGGSSGTHPEAPLALDATGHLYGTAYQGGSANVGMVYKLTQGKNKKWTQSVLHNFAGGSTDGSYPYFGDGVVLDAKGNVYGASYQGGSTSNYGTVYELALTKGKYKENILHAFTGGATDGCYVRAGLLLLKGNLYGATFECGAHSGGVVFEVKP